MLVWSEVVSLDEQEASEGETSMSTSLLYHGFGVRGYRHVATRFSRGQVVFVVVPREEPTSCPRCGSRSMQRRGYKERHWQTVPIGRKQVFVRLRIPRIGCRSCGRVVQMPVPFAVPGHSDTRVFERYVLQLRRRMTIQDVTRPLGITWWMVKEIERRLLERQFARPRLKDLRYLAIDEIHVGKGPRYGTVVLDLESGAIVFVGEGKGTEALVPFWKRLRASHA